MVELNPPSPVAAMSPKSNL